MAEQAVSAGLAAVPVISNHHHHITRPVRNGFKKMMGEYPEDDPDVRDHRTYEEKGYVLRRRSQVAPDEEVVETVRHRGEIKPRRPGYNRRSSSMNDGYYGNGNRGYGGGYESEGSVPPRSRTRARSQGSKSQKRGSSSSSTSSSDLGSSTDEEKQIKKAQRKKWITAALASVATIHAAQKIYSSIESHDKRILEVSEGKISPEEAHKKQKATRWQDAAAIGIAALGIKGAISEWNEVQEEHSHHKEMMEKKEEHHKKRLERQRREKARELGGYYKGRDGNWYYDGYQMQDSERSKSRSQSQQLDGPRNGERKMIEGPGRSRSRNGYSDHRNGNDNARSRSRYDGDDDDYYARNNRRRSSRYDPQNDN